MISGCCSIWATIASARADVRQRFIAARMAARVIELTGDTD